MEKYQENIFGNAGKNGRKIPLLLAKMMVSKGGMFEPGLKYI